VLGVLRLLLAGAGAALLFLPAGSQAPL